MKLNGKQNLILVAVVLYVIFPDLFPGPIDDVIVSIVGLLAASKAG